MSAAAIEILPERHEHLTTIETLLDAAFGPGRFAKTAYRLREGALPVPRLSFVCLLDGAVIGSVRFSAITIGADDALLLGPLVVDPGHKNRGYGLRLMQAGLAAANAAGHRLVVLVGDEPYYARAGFARVPPGRIRLPGPVDPARLLALELEQGALDGVAGLARPAPSPAFPVPGQR
jgi:predicted N-acetyltransferase YhbS